MTIFVQGKIMKKLIFTFPFIILFVISAYPQINDSSDYKEYLNQNYELLNKGKNVEAIELLTKGIEKFPNESSLYFRRAEFYRWAEKFDLMENDVKTAIDVADDIYNAYNSGGIMMMGANKCEKAVQLFDSAINIDASKSTAFFNRASSQNCLGNKVKALNDINYALSIDPKNDRAKAFRNELQTEIGGNKKDSSTNTDLLASIEKKIQANPTDSNLKRQLAYMYLDRSRKFEQEKNTKEMFADFDRAIELSPDSQLLTKRGYQYSKYKNFEKAIADFTKAIELSPENPMLYQYRADAYYSLNQFQNALTDYEKVLTFESPIRKYAVKGIERTKLKIQVENSNNN
jgi:tetratricopeptide (TPR) repeat protein